MNILMVCGRTGGHIKNAVNLAKYLKERKKNIVIQFILPVDVDLGGIVEKEGFSYFLLPIKAPPVRFGVGYIIFITKLLISFIRSVIILERAKPDLIISFGSYSCLPIVIVASIRLPKIPLIFHEQNVIPGKANLFLSRLADKVAVAFEETGRYFKRKAYYTGNPLESNIFDLSKEEAIKSLELDQEKFTILITGGSQGSDFLNNLMIEVFKKMPDSIKESLQVIHLAGRRHFASVKSRYRDVNVKNVKIFGFLEEMEEALKCSDLIISRAGAMTLAEITALGKPAILIPYPYARGHQRENAEYLSNKNAALVFNQKDLNPDIFSKSLLDLIKNKRRLTEMAISSRRLGVFDSNERFYNLIHEVVR